MDDALTCAYCFGPVHPTKGPRCPSCGAAHHLQCWTENQGCTRYGCSSSPDMLTKSSQQ